MPSWRCLVAVPPPRRGVEALLLLLARIVAGVMFCVSGWNKVVTEAGRERMVHTLVDAGIPFPVFSAPVLGVIEWIAGGLLVLGLLSRPSALLLAAICAVAALGRWYRAHSCGTERAGLVELVLLPERSAAGRTAVVDCRSGEWTVRDRSSLGALNIE